ncbi:MAG: hypothetical protein WD073_02165 [Xanthobacteraceae bacterium]
MQDHAKRSAGAVMACTLLALFALVLPARAQCGSPPDPQYDTAGYSSWCSCMGGSYNYQTTECVGARSGSSSSSSSSSSSGSGGYWGCRAEARNGAYGYGKDYATEAEARQVALDYCRRYSGGRSCTIKFCAWGAGDSVTGPGQSAPSQQQSSSPSSPSYSAVPPSSSSSTATTPSIFAPGRGIWACRAEARDGAAGWVTDAKTEAQARQIALQNCRQNSGGGACYITFCKAGAGNLVAKPAPGSGKPAQTTSGKKSDTGKQAAPKSGRAKTPGLTEVYDCDECRHKLAADLDKAWASSRTRSYAENALVDYSNCKLKAKGLCVMGDFFALTVRNGCSGSDSENAYRACLGRMLQK